MIIYEKRKKTYYNLLQKRTWAINRLTNLRLIVALLGALNIGFLYIMRFYYFIYYTFLVYVVLFAYIVINHNKLKYNRKYLNALYEINENAIHRLKGNWSSFQDNGLGYRDDDHNFSSDLDIFGQGSLFQYINITTTHMGRQALRKYLTQPCTEREEIKKRQVAINELGRKLSWRQRFMAEGLVISDKSNSNEPLYNFFERKDEIYTFEKNTLS